MDAGPPAPEAADTDAAAVTGAADAPAADVTRLDVIAGELDAVDTALQRLDDGSYWACEVCGEPVDPDRAARQPLVRRCVHHATGPGGTTG